MSLLRQSTENEPVHRPTAAAGARAGVVNRVHRVVRAEAETLRAQQQKRRSLWLPLAICSTLMLVIVYALWALLDGYELSPNGVPDASNQLVLLLLWSVPVTTVVLGLVWIRRGRTAANGETLS